MAVIAPGQIAIVRFPQSDMAEGKPRPVLLLQKSPGPFSDWLTCMISTRVAQAVAGFDELITPGDPDFVTSGLAQPSVIRVARVALVESRLLLGSVGRVNPERLQRIRLRLSTWITGDPDRTSRK